MSQINSQDLLNQLPMETELRKRTLGFVVEESQSLHLRANVENSMKSNNDYVESKTYSKQLPCTNEIAYQHSIESLIMAPTMPTTATTTTSKDDTVLTHSNINGDTAATFRRFSESSADELLRSDESSFKGTTSWNNKNMWRNEVKLNSNYSNAQHITKNKKGYCPRYHNHDEDESDDDGNGCCCYSIGIRRNRISDAIDIGIRVMLVYIFMCLETTKPFKRKLHPEEIWLYKNPRTPDIYSAQALLYTSIFGPLFVTIFQLWLSGDRRDFRAASWVWTLALGLNGLTTSLLKITVGRHRPDFYYRCFPDGIEVLNNSTTPGEDIYNCTGDIHQINEGRKSFPSGHASFSFVAFGFIAMFVAAKLHAFSARGRGQSWRLCVAAMPLILASLIALSRTCDYHHHWEDVLTGSIIGLSITYLIYRQYYPALTSKNCHRPYLRTCRRLREPNIHLNSNSRVYERLSSNDDDADDGMVSYANHGDSNKIEHRRLI